MDKESYNVLIAQMAATIYVSMGGPNISGIRTRAAIKQAKFMASKLGIEEPEEASHLSQEQSRHLSRCGHDPACEV